MSAYSEKGDLQSKTGLDIFLVIGNQDVQQEDNQEGNHQRAAQEVLCQLGQELQNLGLGFDTNADSQDPELGCAEGTGCGGTCTAANIVNGSLIQRKADTQNHGAAGMMDCEEDAVEFASTCVRRINTEQTVSLTDIAYKAQVNNTTPAPAIAHAIFRATGKWFRELPITPEQIAMAEAE